MKQVVYGYSPRAETVSGPPSGPFKSGLVRRAHGVTMNRFDREFWDGARESALAIYTAVEGRKDVPADVRQLVRRVLIEAGERKNRDFREALGLAP